MCTQDKPVITRPQRAVGEQVQCLHPLENAAVTTKTVISNNFFFKFIIAFIVVMMYFNHIIIT